MRSKKNQLKTKFSKLLVFSISLLLLIFVIQSCAVSAMQSEQMTFNPNKTENGLIFGSITFPSEKPKFNGYFIQISFKSSDEKLKKKNSFEIHISPEQILRLKHSGQLDEGKTYLFAMERPEGEYEISGIRLFTNSGIAILQKTNTTTGFNIPFKVKKKEINYIGNIYFNENSPEKASAISYQNNFEEDLIGIKKVQPYIYWDSAKNESLEKITYKLN